MRNKTDKQQVKTTLDIYRQAQKDAAELPTLIQIIVYKNGRRKLLHTVQSEAVFRNWKATHGSKYDRVEGQYLIPDADQPKQPKTI